MTMKSKIVTFTVTLLSVLFFTTCNFLDIVPDNVIEESHMFETRERAMSALATVYRYMPSFVRNDDTMTLAGDEWAMRMDTWGEYRNRHRAINIMRGLNNSDSPLLNYWEGFAGADGLYRGIRFAQLFLNNIAGVPGVTPSEQADWSAQARFLIAYYHYWLLRLYGPIVLVDEMLDTSAPVDEVRLPRSCIDTSFDFILNIINEVIASNALPVERPGPYLGKIDQQIAKAIRAEIMLLRASPLFNGNSAFFSNFRGYDGGLLFPQEHCQQKWVDALAAIEEAIAFAHQNGRELFHFEGTVPFWDRDDFDQSYILRYVYNNRFSIKEPWNNELIWGYSRIPWGSLPRHIFGSTQIRALRDMASTSYSRQELGASFHMVTLFHTRNGLPIEHDLTFAEDPFALVTIPEDNFHRAIMQPGQTTVEFHLNREPRFYAWLIVDRSVWRGHTVRNDIRMRHGEMPGGRQGTGTGYFLPTGIGVGKHVHPDSEVGSAIRRVHAPFPIIRLADLYLMLAEAYNEVHGPGARAFNKLNAIRARAGLRTVQDTWSDPTITHPSVLNSHLTQDGLREIIFRERAIELSFEGKRYWDVLRWMRADRYFTRPVMGWNTATGVTTAEAFYMLSFAQARTWHTPRDYFFPIPLMELRRNPRLVQNPGW